MSKLYGILAYPAGHSLSPVMFNAAFKAKGIDAQYGFFEVPESDLRKFMEDFGNGDLSGVSVSLPHKETVMNYLHEVAEDAKKIGAVNCVAKKGGFLYGYNFDYVGAMRALKEVCGDLRGRKCVVMGAGGAARSIVYGLVKEGAEVRIWNRTESKARALCEEFACELGKEGEILIQTTSFWTLKPDASQAEIDEFCPDEFVEQFEVVMEIAYSPLITPLLAKAQCMGKKIVTGEKMLLYQAFEQFKVFTGEEAPEGVMREALLRNLK